MQFQELLDLQTDEEPDFVHEIVEMYVTDAREMLNELGTLFDVDESDVDYDKARAVLHKLKGSSSTFGADGVLAKCEELREHCVATDLKKCASGEGSLEELKENVDRLSEFLAKYVAKGKEIHEFKSKK